MPSTVLVDACRRRRSPATLPSFHQGRPPRNEGQRYPADPPTVEEINAVMHAAGEGHEAIRLRGLIVLSWRAWRLLSEALALTESNLDLQRDPGGDAILRARRRVCPFVYTFRQTPASVPAKQQVHAPALGHVWVSREDVLAHDVTALVMSRRSIARALWSADGMLLISRPSACAAERNAPSARIGSMASCTWCGVRVVHDRGWSADHYEAWIKQTLTQQLLE